MNDFGTIQGFTFEESSEFLGVLNKLLELNVSDENAYSTEEIINLIIKKMIKSIDYKLTKQPGTLSEEQFYPNPKLLSFFEENKNNSRILAIKASNSSGKSFLLNSIANSFNALSLPKEELSPTLRRSITFLADTIIKKLILKLILKIQMVTV